MMESSICKNIIWRDNVYSSKKKLEQIIIDAKNISQSEIDKMIKNKDMELSSILTLRKYTPRSIDIVVWEISDKIMFRFLSDNFSWNEYNKDKNYYECLKDIGEIIIKEFSILYGKVNFISYLENQRYWSNKHSYIFSI